MDDHVTPLENFTLVEGVPAAVPDARGGPTVYFARREECAALFSLLGLTPDDLNTVQQGNTHHESHYGFDYLFFSLPNPDDPDADKTSLQVFLYPGLLLLLHEDQPFIAKLKESIRQKPTRAKPVEFALLRLFSTITEGDIARIADLEEAIGDLEDAISENLQIEYTARISDLRRRLLVLKRHYEALIALLEDVEENQNRLIDGKEMRFFSIQTDKVTRLYHDVLNLRDYVTQVREAYQAQVDISLNKTMKLFTVITTIFLPLTLIAGWYGMNVYMPETEYPYTYAIIILASVLVIGVSIWYFKRNKWF